MKKTLALFLALLMSLNLIGCASSNYKKATELFNNGDYAEAITIYESLGDYKDSSTKIEACEAAIEAAILAEKYTYALSLMDAKKYEEAISAFEEVNGYEDSEELITVCQTAIKDIAYNDAVALMDAENFDEAYNAFLTIGDYKDSIKRAYNIRLNRISPNCKVGDYIKLGVYEQDNVSSNGNEEIEWLVLDLKDEKALVVSKYALDSKQYNKVQSKVTWETCSLRKWLNEDFIATAFDYIEKAIISTVTVPACNSYSDSTRDKIFLLSYTEAREYFSSDSLRACIPTEYAIAQRTSRWNGSENCWWWLRSTSQDKIRADYVDECGIAQSAHFVDLDRTGIRPAMWIDLNPEKTPDISAENEQQPDSKNEQQLNTNDEHNNDVTKPNSSQNLDIQTSTKDWMKDQAIGKDYSYNDGGEYYCMGKNDTCPNKTKNAYDLYCSSCDPNGDNKEG